MVFNSFSYFIFLPLVFVIFLAVTDRYRWLVLLLSSYVYYGFILKPILLIALTAVILVTFLIGRLIDRSEDRSKRRMFLWVGVFINLTLLIYFKYLPFLVHNINQLCVSLGIDIAFDKPLLLASIGLSFFIFQAISYLADIYYRMAKPEPHLGYFALYISFFPKLLQGPIERAGDLIPQLKVKYELNYNNIRFGILLFTWGLLKKIVIADRIGLYVDVVYNDVHSFTGLPLLLATYAYAFQIYMDFSGYTDMALGSARLFNIELTQNFNSPYLATSVADYWRRWHISLSSWIRDYIFEPLQMNFRNWKHWGTALALVLAFIISGIWHGASWGFAIWGGLHGLYMACSVFYKPYQKKLHRALRLEKTFLLKVWQIFITFNLVSFALVFFRSNNLKDAVYLISNILYGKNGLNAGFLLSQGRLELAITMGSIMMFAYLAVNIFSSNRINDFNRKTSFNRYLIYNILILMVFFLANYSTKKTFIYFQF